MFDTTKIRCWFLWSVRTFPPCSSSLLDVNVFVINKQQQPLSFLSSLFHGMPSTALWTPHATRRRGGGSPDKYCNYLILSFLFHGMPVNVVLCARKYNKYPPTPPCNFPCRELSHGSIKMGNNTLVRLFIKTAVWWLIREIVHFSPTCGTLLSRRRHEEWIDQYVYINIVIDVMDHDIQLGVTTTTTTTRIAICTQTFQRRGDKDEPNRCSYFQRQERKCHWRIWSWWRCIVTARQRLEEPLSSLSYCHFRVILGVILLPWKCCLHGQRGDSHCTEWTARVVAVDEDACADYYCSSSLKIPCYCRFGVHLRVLWAMIVALSSYDANSSKSTTWMMFCHHLLSPLNHQKLVAILCSTKDAQSLIGLDHSNTHRR
jgi:hypothetical protein